MENYNLYHTQYYTTIECTSGCGSRAQTFIDKAYDNLVKAYYMLSINERKKISLPELHKCSDDGSHGITSGLASFSRYKQ